MSGTEAAVVLVRGLAAPPSAVYQAWTDPALMRRWLAPGANVVVSATADVRVGGTYRLEMRDPEGADHRITGVYRELRADQYIAKTWIYTGPLGTLCGMETLLEVALREIGVNATELTLTHTHIAGADALKAYQADWPTCMDKLQNVFGPAPS